MVRLFYYNAILCLLIVTTLGIEYSVAQGKMGSAALTLKVFAQSDSVRAYAAGLYDGNGALIDSAVATGNQVQFLNVPTSVLNPSSSQTPTGYWLEQNYPNPFNPSTRIKFQIPQAGTVTLQIFDILGRTVASYTGNLQAGVHEFKWEAGVATGVYFYRIIAGSYTSTKKMLKLDGGGSGNSSLEEIGSTVTSGTSANINGKDAYQSNETLRKVGAHDYSVKIYNLLQTNPQVIDTVIQLSGFNQDTILSISIEAAPRNIIIPMPDSMQMTDGSFVLTDNKKIYIFPGSDEIKNIGQFLADRLAPATGYTLEVSTETPVAGSGNIFLSIIDSDTTIGEEGYILTIRQDSVMILAHGPAGLFHGVQTFRQLFPPAIESSTVWPGPWKIQTGRIVDHPRFPLRCMMMDIARHFFGVEDIKHLIDLLAYYKMNHLQLQLANDGWRIEIKSWPDLAIIGGQSNKSPIFNPGYYTQIQYSEIVAYAQSRYITIIPCIDVPGHFGGALVAYPQLNWGGNYWTNPMFYAMLDDVFREISVLTPGKYFHPGGDEAYGIPVDEYLRFQDSVQTMVRKYGKQAISWGDYISQTHLLPTTIFTHWQYILDTLSASAAVQQGAKVLMMPANKVYLDMKYNPSTSLGLAWAGYIEVEDAYNWDPATTLTGVTERDIIGVETPLWSETVVTMDDIEYMAFPRLAGQAEIGWSPVTGRNWDEYKVRLGYHGLRLSAMGVNFYHSPQVQWK